MLAKMLYEMALTSKDIEEFTIARDKTLLKELIELNGGKSEEEEAVELCIRKIAMDIDRVRTSNQHVRATKAIAKNT